MSSGQQKETRTNSGRQSSIYLRTEEEELLNLYAGRVQRSRNWVVRQALQQFFKQQAENEKTGSYL